MSILDELRKDIAAGNWTTNDLPSALAYNQALHEAGEALLNPTDEQVRAIADLVECSCEAGYADTCPIHGAAEWMVRAVLAAAAGGDQ